MKRHERRHWIITQRPGFCMHMLAHCSRVGHQSTFNKTVGECISPDVCGWTEMSILSSGTQSTAGRGTSCCRLLFFLPLWFLFPSTKRGSCSCYASQILLFHSLHTPHRSGVCDVIYRYGIGDHSSCTWARILSLWKKMRGEGITGMDFSFLFMAQREVCSLRNREQMRGKHTTVKKERVDKKNLYIIPFYGS